MPRNRMIKTEFWTSEQVLSCSVTARLLFIGLWNFCDDNGVHQASYVRLKAEVFPVDAFTLDDVKKWVSELLNTELIREYVIDEKAYWIVTGWKKHQQINKPTYRHPLPQSALKTISNSGSPTVALQDYSGSATVDVQECSLTPTVGVATKEKEKEKEKEKREKDIREVVPTSPRCVSENQMSSTQEVFTYWQQVLGHPKAKLDSKRQRAIKQALKTGYTVEQLKQAIDGCANTPFNMGENDKNQRYDDIGLILRDAAHIERFIRNADNSAGSSQKPVAAASDIFAGAI